MHSQLHIEHDGKIEEHHVVFGQREIVHHRWTVDADHFAAQQLAIHGSDVIRNERRSQIVAKEMSVRRSPHRALDVRSLAS